MTNDPLGGIATHWNSFRQMGSVFLLVSKIQFQS